MVRRFYLGTIRTTKRNMKIRSKKHRKYVSGLSCLISQYWDDTVSAHHLLRAGGKGMGNKACDSLCIPLRSIVHEKLHKDGNEVTFLAYYGWNYLNLLETVKEINSLSPDRQIRESTAVDEAIKYYKELKDE